MFPSASNQGACVQSKRKMAMWVGICLAAFSLIIYLRKLSPLDSDILGKKLLPAPNSVGGYSTSDPSDHKYISTIMVDAAKQKLLGIEVKTIEAKPGVRWSYYSGLVKIDETKIFRLNAGIDGAIHDYVPLPSGSTVRKNQLLFSIVAPSAIPALQLFILNSQALAKAKYSPTEGQNAEALANSNLKQRIEQLESYGLSPGQIAEIAERQEFPESIRILSPADGIVLESSVMAGLKFEKGMDLVRIVNLDTVWTTVNVFQSNISQFVRSKQVLINVPERQISFVGTIDASVPQFNEINQSYNVRIITKNSNAMLIPGMKVEVAIPEKYPKSIVIPESAIVDDGSRKSVFVEIAPGQFTSQDVELGWQQNQQSEVLHGLSSGQKIVINGTFLLKSAVADGPPNELNSLPLEGQIKKQPSLKDKISPVHTHHLHD